MDQQELLTVGKEYTTEADSFWWQYWGNVWSQVGEAAGGQRKLLEFHNLYSSPNTTALELSNWGGETGGACSMHAQFWSENLKGSDDLTQAYVLRILNYTNKNVWSINTGILFTKLCKRCNGLHIVHNFRPSSSLLLEYLIFRAVTILNVKSLKLLNFIRIMTVFMVIQGSKPVKITQILL